MGEVKEDINNKKNFIKPRLNKDAYDQLCEI